VKKNYVYVLGANPNKLHDVSEVVSVVECVKETYYQGRYHMGTKQFSEKFALLIKTSIIYF